ncbi:MAG: CoB--CoM heterodisulfide reductase iron-sulfur subunit A family protein [Bacteroidales bacterium]|nr:CoB--CoM heterodisulfide reductase iron-sulfur subunit A family protein [Bacteroidales bacterium]MCF8457666.1 CoB--CoM heterodisulfide reductase iron-sulfur subunit A family protein [Bacteroidales bacterium]
MLSNDNTAIFLCPPVNGDSQQIDLKDIEGFAKDKLKVSHVWDCASIPVLNADQVSKKIQSFNITKIILAGQKPGFYKTVFTRAMKLVGEDPANVMLAGFSEYGAVHQSQTDLAKAIVACAYFDVPFEQAIPKQAHPARPETLVIGGGIAGIQAALEIANGNQKVYLLERTGTIGGHMAMFDKTFPTLDCAACILTPKMVEVGQHPLIEMLTYSELTEVTGIPGDYRVKINKRARRVNLSTCIGCGTCAEKCPQKALSEFDAETGMRKAIYIPFPQAVPNKYLIDAENCTYVKNGKCGVCVKVCPVEGCIDLDEKDQEIEINVGNIVVTTGFQTFDARKIERYGYGKFDNVVTSLEFERLVNAAGPTGGNITLQQKDKKGNRVFLENGEVPKSVGIIHCIGSRDENHHKYCSKVCCMYSLKLAHLVKEKLPKAEVYEYYIDMRAFGKGYEEFYNRIADEGIHIVRGRTAKVSQENGQLMLRSENIETLELLEQKVDMVVLAVGLEPREDAKILATKLGISTDPDGWFKEFNYAGDPVGTFTGGITIAGVCQGPKDIPDTVAQASAAASSVLQNIMKGHVQMGLGKIKGDDIEFEAEKLSMKKEVQL